MQNTTKHHKTAYYRVIKTTELISGKPTAMYGVEGFSEGEVVSVSALSCDRERVKKLVDKMNTCGLELCQLRDVVDDFLYDLAHLK